MTGLSVLKIDHSVPTLLILTWKIIASFTLNTFFSHPALQWHCEGECLGLLLLVFVLLYSHSTLIRAILASYGIHLSMYKLHLPGDPHSVQLGNAMTRTTILNTFIPTSPLPPPPPPPDSPCPHSTPLSPSCPPQCKSWRCCFGLTTAWEE